MWLSVCVLEMCWVTLSEKSLHAKKILSLFSVCCYISTVHPGGLTFYCISISKFASFQPSLTADGKQQFALSRCPPAHPQSLGSLFFHITLYIALSLLLTYLLWLMKVDIQFNGSVIVMFSCCGDWIVGLIHEWKSWVFWKVSSLRLVFFVRPLVDFFVRFTGIWSLDVCVAGK